MHRRNVRKEEKERNVASENKLNGNNKALHMRTLNVCKITTYVLVGVIISFFAICLSIYVFVDAPIDAVAYRLPPPEELTGALEPNTVLRFAERLYENELIGPESLEFHQGHIYTGTADGKILDIVNGKIRTLATLGRPPCVGPQHESHCGRPLGMRMHPDGSLIVVDTYLGLFKINLTTGSFNRLLSPDTKIGGITPIFLNDLDIGPDGVIYLSDSSTKWRRKDFLFCLLEGRATGRLIRFDPSTNTTDVLMENLLFANGVQLSKDNDFVLVVELGMAKIHRYYLKGDKMGTADVFADNLPAFPDNIRRSNSGGYWLGSSLIRQPGSIGYIERLSNYPIIRNFITKLLSQLSLLQYVKLTGVLLELDQDGRLVRCFWDSQGETISTTSEVLDDNGVLYIGSFMAPFIAKLDTNNLTPVTE